MRLKAQSSCELRRCEVNRTAFWLLSGRLQGNLVAARLPGTQDHVYDRLAESGMSVCETGAELLTVMEGIMRPYLSGLAFSALSIGLLTALPATAAPFFFSTGDPDGKIATASRPGVGGNLHIESADDFALSNAVQITSATFTGLLTGANPSVGQVVVLPTSRHA